MNGRQWITLQDLLAWLVLALAAVLAVLPLATTGYSCGHDFDFHLRSWMEVSTQWKAGIVKPVWAFHAAWNAGEPRFLFYPPLSWITGGLLTLLLPWSAVVSSFTGLVLFLSGVTMHRLLRRWVSPGIAVLGGCLYLANPYMLFCAYERTAYAELMAAAWMPLLLIALLRERVTVWRVAVAVALLWMTNAPAAVVGCYSILLIGGMRWIWLMVRRREDVWPFFARITAGFLLGLLLDGFYLLPLAVERKYVSLTAALTPAASPDENYLFEFSSDVFHNGVLLHSSTIAVVLIAAALLSAGVVMVLERRHVQRFASMHARDASLLQRGVWRMAVPVLMFYSAVVMLLQTPITSAVWHHAPELAFLQFPWRFLAMQSAVTVTLVALMLRRIASLQRTWKYGSVAAVVTGLAFTAVAGYGLANRTFRQGCDDEEGLAAQWMSFHRGEGFEQTDEYTPDGDDNDAMKIKLPPAWVAQSSDDEPASADGSFPLDVPLPQEQSMRMDDFLVTATAPEPGEHLIVRLRAFHGWHVLLDGTEITGTPQRADGLYAVPLITAGPHRVELRYRKPWDQWAGGGLSLLGMLCLAGVMWREESQRDKRTESALQ